MNLEKTGKQCVQRVHRFRAPDTDGVWVDAIMDYGWDMDALAERMGLGGRYHGRDMDDLWVSFWMSRPYPQTL